MRLSGRQDPRLTARFTQVVGDIHGQFSDLIRLFQISGYPPKSNYLFLGDYVDRGRMGLETTLLLLCYKIKYPENFFMLRGNHECSAINRIYGFFDECKMRASIKSWKVFNELFDCLPYAAIISDKILGKSTVDKMIADRAFEKKWGDRVEQGKAAE